MRTNMLNLVSVARAKGSAVASSWTAHRHDETGDIAVVHYRTHMFTVHSDDTVTGESVGWGSMTDKCGTRKILSNVNGKGYADIFG
jgi:hypothetical protein